MGEGDSEFEDEAQTPKQTKNETMDKETTKSNASAK
jgi:hypothetical protein